MKRYEFTITISGIGEDEQEAWDHAVDSFIFDPDIPDEAECTIHEEDEE